MLRTPIFALALAVLALPAIAATPESGTITKEQKTVEWTGGPYIIPNLTPTLGLADQPPVCEEGTELCDVFRFEVNLTGANLDEDAVVITVGWEDDGLPSTPAADTPDYDLYLYDDSTGDLILTQASAANPEVMFLPAENRKYRLDLIPFAAMNQPYSGKVAYVPFEEQKTLGIFSGAFGPAALLMLALGLALRRR